MKNGIKTIGTFSGQLLKLAEKCDEIFSSLRKPESDDLREYDEQLNRLIERVHIAKEWQELVYHALAEHPDYETGDYSLFDCCHVQYRSLMQYVYARAQDREKSERKKENTATEYVRLFFAPPKVTEEDAKQQIFRLLVHFAYASQSYETGCEILPPVDADICSLVFFPETSRIDLGQYVRDGIYAFDKDAISILVKTLSSIPQLRPYAMSPSEFTELYEKKVKISQEEGAHLWDAAKEKHKNAWGEFVPNAEGIFHFALHSCLNTLQIISKQLFEHNPRREPEAPKIREDLLEVLTKDSGQIQSRALSFMPIRVVPHPALRRAQHSLKEYETIGFVVLYSVIPIAANSLLPVAIAERVILASLRQREFNLVGARLTDSIADLRVRILYAKRLAHSIKTPFQQIHEVAATAADSAELAEKALKNFTEGNFQKLKRPHKTEIYTALTIVEGAFYASIDRKKISYENQVQRNIFVYADPEDFQFILEVLFDNASKHAESVIRVHSEVKEEEKGKYTYITVENDGRKIPGHMRELLFQPSLRVTRENSGLGRGFGVGLHLAKRFAEENQGELIYDDSPSNKYNTFVLKLPQSLNQ